jgi:hypothetical protein
MALDKFTQITKSGIVTTINFECHHLHSTGIATFSAGSISALDGTFSGDVSIGGTLTYQDVTNIDSVGLVTARLGLNVTAGVSTFAAAIDANGGVDISGGSGLVASTAKISDLTDNRVVIGGSSGELEDSANLTFDGSNLGVGSKVTVTNANADADNTNSLGAEINAAWIRLGDVTAAKSFSNGLGIKYYDQGTSHWSTGTIGNKFYISNTSNDGNKLFPSGRTDGITIDSTANVGINETSPVAKLHIQGSADAPCLVLPDTTNTRYSVGFGNINVSGVGQRLDFYTGDSGNNSNNLTSAHRRMSLTSQGRLGIGLTNPSTILHLHDSTNTRIQFTDNGTGAASGDGVIAGLNGDDDFFINNRESGKGIKFFTGSDNLRLHITSDGQLLHTANKASGYIAEFHQDNASNSGQILIDSPTNNDGRPTFIDLSRAGTLQWSIGQGYNHSGGAFHFATSNLGAGITGSKLTITSTGKVGINQTNPTTALLEVFNSGTAVQGLDVYTNDVGTTAIAKFRGYNNTHGAQDRLIITAKGTLQLNADVASDTEQVAHFQAVNNNKHGILRVNGHSGTNAVQGILELIGYAAGGGHGRHAFIAASTDGGTYATKMDFKLRETSAQWQHTQLVPKLTLHPGYAGTVDVKGIPAHLRLYSQRDTSDWDSTDPIGKLDFYVGDDTTNNLPYNAGFIHCLNDTNNANEPSGALVFGTTTANLSGGAVERLRISSSGYMQLKNASGSTFALLRNNAVADSTSLLGSIDFGTTDWDSSTAAIKSYQDGAKDNASLRFYTQPNVGSGVQERLRITSSGQVNIAYTGANDDTPTGLYVNSIGRFNNWVIGNVPGTGNNSTGCILLHRMDGNTVGGHVGGMLVINSYTGQSTLFFDVNAYYSTDAVSGNATKHSSSSASTLKLVTVELDDGSDYMAIKKDGGGTGTASMNAYFSTNIHSNGGVREINSGYTVTATHATW